MRLFVIALMVLLMLTACNTSKQPGLVMETYQYNTLQAQFQLSYADNLDDEGDCYINRTVLGNVTTVWTGTVPTGSIITDTAPLLKVIDVQYFVAACVDDFGNWGVSDIDEVYVVDNEAPIVGLNFI